MFFFAVSHRIPKEQLASILRGRRDTLEACHCYCDVFSWQVQHFVLVHCPLSWQAQHFVTWRRCCFVESQWQGWCQKSWQGQHFVSALKSGGSFAKIIRFELCKNTFVRKTRGESSIFSFKVCKVEEVSHEMLVLEACNVKIAGSLPQNARLESLLREICRQSRTKPSFSRSWEVLLAFRRVAESSKSC